MLNIIGICMLIIGAVGIFVSILLAFLWKVPDLLDELSGKKAKRQIKRLREMNVGTGGMEGISTNELYEMLNNSGNLVWKNVGSGRIDFESEVEGKEEEEEDKEEAKQDVKEDVIPGVRHETEKSERVDEVEPEKEVGVSPQENEEIEESKSSSIQSSGRRIVVIKEQSSIDLEVLSYEE